MCAFFHYVCFVVAVGENHQDIRSQCPECFQRLPAIHARHGEVEDYEADLIPALTEDLYGLEPMTGLDHFKP